MRRVPAVQHLQALVCQDKVERLFRKCTASRAPPSESHSTKASPRSEGSASPCADGGGSRVPLVGDRMKARIEEKLALVDLMKKIYARQRFYQLEKHVDITAVIKTHAAVKSPKRKSLHQCAGGRKKHKDEVGSGEAGTQRSVSGAKHGTTCRHLVLLAPGGRTGSPTRPSSQGGAAASGVANGRDEWVLAEELKSTWKQLRKELQIAKTARGYLYCDIYCLSDFGPGGGSTGEAPMWRCS